MSLEFQVIRTERFLLRQFTNSDLQNVFSGLSNPDVIRYYGISYATLEETELQMQFFRELEEKETGIWWAICSHDNQIFYGGGGFNNWSKIHKKAEIGFWLLPGFWGMGIMKEVLPVICLYGFETLDLHRIEGIVESENSNCKKAIAKANFTFEGTMRECEIKNGRFISLDIYSRLKKDS